MEPAGSPHRTFGDGSGLRTFSLLNAQNRTYTPFWTAEYEIIGTYYSVGTEPPPEHFGYTPPYSRRLCRFGFGRRSSRAASMRYVAIILFAAGLLSALAILVLLLYFFIVKQKKRTAIERSLGMSKNQCRVSLVSGVVVLSAVAVILGTVCSSVLFDKVQTLDLTGQSEHTSAREYSLWARDEMRWRQKAQRTQAFLEVVIPAAMILLTAGLSVILVNRSLKYELIEMLNK